jgi:hypothetical protein
MDSNQKLLVSGVSSAERFLKSCSLQSNLHSQRVAIFTWHPSIQPLSYIACLSHARRTP